MSRILTADVEKMEDYKNSKVHFTAEEVEIIIEILSIFDNRHDFREGGRNQSITIDDVLKLLQDKTQAIRKKITDTMKNKKQLEQLLNIHCSSVKKHTIRSCATAVNPDKEVEKFIITRMLQEKLTPPKAQPSSTDINGKSIIFSSREELIKACGYTLDSEGGVVATQGRYNPFLSHMLDSLSKIVKSTPDKIKFCIDYSKVGEWVFRHDGRTDDASRTHFTTIADNYDTFTNISGNISLPLPISLQKNHIMLEKFNLYSEKITWSSSQYRSKQEITFRNNDMLGVATMSEAISIVLSRTNKKSRAVGLIKRIFKLPYEKGAITADVYGKHIMDFKRLMDMSKLAVTLAFNKHDEDNRTFILVTHDVMLYLLAKMYKCPVIYTAVYGDGKRELLFDIPQLSQAQRQTFKAAQEQILAAFWIDFPPITVEIHYKPQEVTIKQLPKDPEQLFNTLLNVFVRYLNKLKKDYNDHKIPEKLIPYPETYKKNAIAYVELVQKLNREYFDNPPPLLEDKIKKLASILNEVKGLPKYVKEYTVLFTEILEKTTSQFDATKSIKKEVMTGTRFEPSKYESITFGSTKFLTTLKKYMGGSIQTEEDEIGNYALDLLYKYINKNIDRYYAQTVNTQIQAMWEAYITEVGQSPTDDELIRFKKEREALFQKYIEADQSGPKAASAPPMLPKQVTARVLSAPPILPAQPYQPPMQVDAQSKRGVKRTHRPVTHGGPRGKIPMTVTQEEMLARMSEL